MSVMSAIGDLYPRALLTGVSGMFCETEIAHH